MERDLKCMYCAEAGITNTDVFIEIVDVELGAGWICKECFIESEKEKEEHLKELEQELKAKEQECEELKRIRDGNFLHALKEQKRADKLSKTLTEIKEIVTNFYETGFLRTDDDCILINNHLCVKTLDKILQKISEVEDV